MAVVIEELEAEVGPSRDAGEAPARDQPPPPETLDERALAEWLARDAWRQQRLAAD